MPAIGNLVLKDGQATPANHTYTPVNADVAGLAKWADKASGTPSGYDIATLQFREPVSGNALYRTTTKLVMPTISDGSDGSPAGTKIRTAYADVSIACPEGSTNQERKDLLAGIISFLQSAYVTAAVVDTEYTY